MAAPLQARASGKPVAIEVIGELISKPYIEITLNLMARFGVQVRREGWSRFVIEAGASYRSPGRSRSRATRPRRPTSWRWARSAAVRCA